MLPVRDANPAGDCGGAKQLLLSTLPACAQRFGADHSLAETDKQEAGEGRSLGAQQTKNASILSFQLSIRGENA